MHQLIRGNCLVVGPQASGKTSLIHALAEARSEFSRTYNMVKCTFFAFRSRQTVLPELLVKSILVAEKNTAELLIYDYPGSLMYIDLLEKYVPNLNMLAFVFDLTDRESFEACGTWIKKAKGDAKKLKVPGILIGNKSDLSLRRKVTETEAKKFAEENELDYMETSVKENRNILPPFSKLASQYCDLYKTTSVKFQELL